MGANISALITLDAMLNLPFRNIYSNTSFFKFGGT